MVRGNRQININGMTPLSSMGATSSDLKFDLNKLIKEKLEIRRLLNKKQEEINQAETNYFNLLKEEEESKQ